ncbi:MAG: DnaJ domain-containing protein [Methylovulum sp.]
MLGRIHSLKEAYGFIIVEDGHSIFFHKSKLINCKLHDLQIGDGVEFNPVKERGKWNACDIYFRQRNGDSRIIFCPACGQKIRIPLPISVRICRCSSCEHRFKVAADELGTLYIYTDPNELFISENLTVSGALEILEVTSHMGPEDIKAAFKRKIREYHPDKVATLGYEIKKLADKKTKQINLAYRVLCEHTSASDDAGEAWR